MLCCRRQKWREKVLMWCYRFLSGGSTRCGGSSEGGVPKPTWRRVGKEVREGFPEEVVIELELWTMRMYVWWVGWKGNSSQRKRQKTPFWELELV